MMLMDIELLIKLAHHFEELAGMTIHQAEKILGLSGRYNLQQLTHTYRQNILQHHPDISKESDAGERTQKIVEAYRLLKLALEKQKEPAQTNERGSLIDTWI